MCFILDPCFQEKVEMGKENYYFQLKASIVKKGLRGKFIQVVRMALLYGELVDVAITGGPIGKSDLVRI